MKECAERHIKLGLTRDAKKVVDEVERTTAEMVREGWVLRDTIVEDLLGSIHLLFEREIERERYSR